MIASVADTTTDNLKFLPTCTVSLIMDLSIDLCWLRSQLVEGWLLWRLPRTTRQKCCGDAGRVAYGCGCDPHPGIAHCGLAAAVGSQFLTDSPRRRASHSGPAGVRVFEPGASRAIHWRFAVPLCQYDLRHLPLRNQ